MELDAVTALFMLFELDRVVDDWHGPAARPLLMEGHHVAGIEYRNFVTYGLLSVAKGQEGRGDEILRRTAWRERLGLAGYQYEHGRALAMSVEAPVTCRKPGISQGGGSPVMNTTLLPSLAGTRGLLARP